MVMNGIAYLDENAQTPYPLGVDIGFNSVIVDANFIQFDGFIPILQTIKVDVDSSSGTPQVDISITILFDAGAQTVIVSPTTQNVYLSAGGRTVGKLVFGVGLSLLSSRFANKLITLNAPFLASTVRSINSKCGVYSLNGHTYTVALQTDDKNMYFNISGNTVTWNCVGFPNTTGGNALKTLNGVSPDNNSIYLSDSTLLRIASGPSSLTFSSIGDSSQIFPTTP